MSEETTLRQIARDLEIEALDYHGHAHEYLISAAKAVNQAAITIETVTRERDEARAKLAQFDEKYNIEALQAALDAEAKRGYRKGVEDAANVAGNAVIPIDDNEWDDHNRACEIVRAAILALLEQTEPGEKK